MSELEEAWEVLRAATPPGWQVGRPYRHDERGVWEQWARETGTDLGEEARVLSASPPRREWIAIGETEVACLRAMAQCLTELGQGRWPT